MVPLRLASAAVMSFFSLSARPALADVQLTVGVAATAGVAAARDGMNTPAPTPAATSALARLERPVDFSPFDFSCDVCDVP